MKGLRNFISLIVIIILTIMGIYAVCIFNASNFITEKNITNTVKKINLTEVLSENSKATTGTTTQSTMDKIYDMANNVSISKEHVDAVMNSDAIKEFAGDYLSNVATYVATGKESNITGARLTEIVKSNIDIILTDTGINLNSDAKQNIVTGVEKYADEIVTLIPSPKLVTESMDQEQLKGIQELFSKNTKTQLVFGIVGLTLLLMLLQFSLWKWLSWSSVSVAITGLVSCILGLVITPTVEGLLVDHNEVILLSLLNRFTDVLSHNFLITGGVLLAIAFIEISIYVSIKHRLKQKEANLASETLKAQVEADQE